MIEQHNNSFTLSKTYRPSVFSLINEPTNETIENVPRNNSPSAGIYIGDEVILGQVAGKVEGYLQNGRNPFQNLSNCSSRQGFVGRTASFSFTRQHPYSLHKPFIFQKRTSQLTKASEQDSMCDPLHGQKAKQELGEKSSLVLLSDKLEEKVRMIDQSITVKISQIKQQFWQSRAKSLLNKQPVPKPSLTVHLTRKPSLNASPEAIKVCFMKFIPMRSVVQGEGISNKKVVHSRLSRWFSKEFKNDD